MIAALPLGGFVKMLGEEPEDEASKSTDPRAYPEQVGECADGDHLGRGDHERDSSRLAASRFITRIRESSSRRSSGGVTAGSPAYQAGLRPGDEIVAIDGRRNLAYADLLETVVLSSSGQVLHFQINRPGSSSPMRRQPGSLCRRDF